MSGISLAKSLELNLAQPFVTADEVTLASQRAADNHLACVIVWPAHVALVARALEGSDTRVRAAIGFPHGYDVVDVKIAACDRAIADGAHEVAIMLDHTSLGHGGDSAPARAELDRLLGHAWWRSIASARGRAEATIVLETMSVDPYVLSSVLPHLASTVAGFVQTGSGTSGIGVTDEHVRHLRELLPDDIAIIAAGGAGDIDDAHALINAGAVRLASTSALTILEQERHARRSGTPSP